MYGATEVTPVKGDEGIGTSPLHGKAGIGGNVQPCEEKAQGESHQYA